MFGGGQTFLSYGGQLGRLKQSLMSPGFTGITFVGDSITWGTGTMQGPSPNPRTGTLADPRDLFSSESFVNNFKRFIGEVFVSGARAKISNWPSSPRGESIVEFDNSVKRVRISNQGINGASTYSYKTRNLVAGIAENYAPMDKDGFVFVQLGANDRGMFPVNPKNGAELADRIVDIVRSLSRSHEVILMCPNPAVPEPENVYRFKMAEVRDAIRAAAKRCNVDCIDNFAAFPEDPSGLLLDGLHPNVAGHLLMSNNIKHALVSA